MIPHRTLLSALAAAILAIAGVERVPQPAAQTATALPIARTTLRVGMWTLWHDHEVVLKPTGPDRKITFRTCGQCATLSLSQAVTVRAIGYAVALSGSSSKGNATHLWLTGEVTLAAHGETITLHNPVEITARAGALVIAVTLDRKSVV